ncbi:MAG TPA: F0F1 ATP synthase subunit B [Sphingomicrobium sp.]|nr:F0F1 ATP synthase subunit B [Sphingomicrobium sp.]
MLELMLAAAAAEHGEAVAHAEPSALGMDPTQWVALSMIAILALFIWKKVPAAVGRALDKKIDGIRAQLAEAESLRKDAEALKAEYESKARAAEGEAAAMVERARTEAKQIVAKAKTDAKALVERRSRMAEDKIAAEERAAIADIRATTARAASAAAARLVAEKHDAGSDKALVDKAIAGL